MPKKRTAAADAHPNLFFADQLRGENPPSFAAMEELYRMSRDLFALRPWDLLEENCLILVRHPEKDELCYCSIMGAIGEVFQMQAYIGAESYRVFRKISEGVATDPAEFLASLTSVSVEYVPKAELEPPDRKLLAALHHPSGKGAMAPVFRAIRPGYQPWYVTREEAIVLATCLRATIALCSEVARAGTAIYWSQPDAFPLFVADGDRWHVEQVEPVLPPEAPLPPAQAAPDELARLRGRGHAVRGVIELDCSVSMLAVGTKNERKACTAIAMAADANSGFLYTPELANASAPVGDMMARVLIGAIRSTETFPAEVRVRDRRWKDCLHPVAEALGLSIKVVRRLPTLEKARAAMLGFLAR